jgi:hypothetical protein
MMWYDELATYYPAKLPTVAALLDFFRQGLDVHTPTASLLLRVWMKLFGSGPVVDRMPFALGCLVFCISIFVFVSRRCSAVYAAAAMIFPALTLLLYYATEIRCYGILLGFIGLVLVSWQAAADGRKRALAAVGFFAGLAGAICCHYYAVLLWIPLGLAELTRTFVRKRIDWPVWLALILSPLVILIFLPSIRNASAYRSSMWSKPHFSQIAGTYVELFFPCCVPLLAATILILLLAPRFSISIPGAFKPAPAAEWVLAGALALLPVYAVPLSIVSGGFVPRYALAAVGGVTILLAFALSRCLKGQPFAATIMTLFFLAWFIMTSVNAIRAQAAQNGGLGTPLGSPLQTSTWVRELEKSDLPIAATPALFFMKLQYYASAEMRRRVHYLSDEQMAQRFHGLATTEMNLVRFRRGLPLRVIDLSDFISQNPRFLVCLETVWDSWVLQALIHEGAQIRLAHNSGSYFIFEVTMP